MGSRILEKLEVDEVGETKEICIFSLCHHVVTGLYKFTLLVLFASCPIPPVFCGRLCERGYEVTDSQVEEWKLPVQRCTSLRTWCPA